MTATDRVLAVCSLRRAPWPSRDGRCCWCDHPLPKGCRRWCSQDCTREFGSQHNWGAARHAALERDQHRCRRCGLDSREALDQLRAVKLLTVGLASVLHGRRLHVWDLRPEAARRSISLEVNHRTPILGRHQEFGCHHHLDGLETLCRPCHLAETARQFDHRAKPPQEAML